MGDCTLEVNEELERYRFIFLDYIDVARRLVHLRRHQQEIATLKNVLASGWSPDDPHLKDLAKEVQRATTTLHRLYNTGYTLHSLNTGVLQYDSDLEQKTVQEQSLWSKVLSAVNAVVETGYWSYVWSENDPERDHQDLISGDHAEELLLDFKSSLERLDTEPEPPQLLRADVVLHYASLWTILPPATAAET